MSEVVGREKTEEVVMGRNYSSESEDIAWSCGGLTTRICNGVTVPALQQIIVDIGMEDFKVVTLRSVKVFLHVLGQEEVMSRFNKTTECFHECLYDCCAWSKDNNMVYERTVWVRCYGISLHAWNFHFFILLLLWKVDY